MSHIFQRPRLHWRRCRHTIIAMAVGITFTYIYCEYLIYYIVQSQCDWPVNKINEKENPVRALILADTHLLGSRHGHWLDKMRREWQMHRAFQTAVTLHRPEVVFVLGDLFDEGLWCSEHEFDDYVERFQRLFHLPDTIKMYAVVGNHDIGFHYRITPHLANRFERQLQAPPVQLVSVRGNHFVLLNSMAMEGDGCDLCSRAEHELDKVANLLKCTSGSSVCQGDERLPEYSRPVLMQHFPLYRQSDLDCQDGDAPTADRTKMFEQRWDCLSRESTERLVESLTPRAVFGGHTHHWCRRRHLVGSAGYGVEIEEYSVASFSHRNRVSPEYVLALFTPDDYAVSRCRVPEELTLKWSAAILLCLSALYVRYVAWGGWHRRLLKLRLN